MAFTSSVWLQPASAVVDSANSKETDMGKRYLIGTEIALARTIHNCNKQQSPARNLKLSRRHPSNKNMWPSPPTSASVNFLHKDDTNSQLKPQSKPSSSRPQSSATQRKPSSKRLVKSRTLSALHSTSNTSTAKDLELLTKSITKQLSIKYKGTSQQSSLTVIS